MYAVPCVKNGRLSSHAGARIVFSGWHDEICHVDELHGALTHPPDGVGAVAASHRGTGSLVAGSKTGNIFYSKALISTLPPYHR